MFEFNSNLDILTYFTAKNRSKSLICIHGIKNYIRGLRFGTHTQIVLIFCHAWAIFGLLVDRNTWKRELVELSASDTWGLSFIRIRFLPLKGFANFFLNVLPYQFKSWFIHWVGCTTYWVDVSLEWDPCDLFMFLAYAQLTNKAFTDAGKGRIRQSLTALVDWYNTLPILQPC